ncbi:retrovirus-related pol polyprotein from transposon TNT 1-94, partial [Tanacetum coccineum]
EVEDHHRIYSISNKTKSITACNDSLNSRTSNAIVVCATGGKCLVDSDHFACVTKYLNDVHARTKKPNVVPISSRKPKSHANKSVATPNKKIVASESTIQKSKSYYRMLYEKTSKAWKWWIEQQCPSGYNWVPKTKMKWVPKTKMTWVPKVRNKSVQKRIVQLILFIIESGCTKHMTDNLSLLCNFVEKYLEFLNKTLHAYFKEEGIEHQTSTPRTPEQNGIVEIPNHTLVEATRTMLSASKLPLFFWAKAIATACYTQNRSILIPSHEKIAYHIINDRKPSIRQLHIFGCTCYLTIDGENLDKMKEKRNLCILALDYDNSGPAPQLQNVSQSTYTTAPSQQELDLLFGPLYDEFFIAGTSSVNKSSFPTDNSTKQDTQPTTNIHPLTEPKIPTITVHAEENNDNQVVDAHFEPYEFVNPLCTPVREEVETSSRNVDNSNMHTFYQPNQSKHRWTKDHPLTQVHGNPSKPVKTRRQHAIDPEMCMLVLTMSTAEPKNIKEAMADS